MKPNLTQLLAIAGLSLGMLSFASVAEAGINLNSSSLTGQTIEKQPPQQFMGLPRNGSSLTGQLYQKQQKK